MKIFVDEDLPKAIVALLQERGYDAVSVREIGLGGKTDSEIFMAAQQQGAMIMMADVGFGNIMQYEPGSHAGIILLRFPEHFRRDNIVSLVRTFLDNSDLFSLQHALVVVNPGSYRVRR